MDLLDIRFWAGTEQSLLSYVEAVKRVQTDGTLAKADLYAAKEDRPPRLFSKQGDVGVITISGSLNNSSSWINEYIGATGYPEIRDALIYAASHDSVKAIALDIKSGGGHVSGVADTADLIHTIDSRVKPVYAYSDGMIASAAYWLGSSARSVDVGKVTEAGSIGVLVVHSEQSKALANAGITVTVVRSGKYKALGNSAEPLGDLGQTVLQGQVDKLNSMFEAHVAQARGTSAAVVAEKMGQGRVFIGQDAVDVGLADSVINFDAFMSKVQGGIDSQKSQSKYGANSPKGPQLKTALTEQEIAALAAGGGAQPTAEQEAEAEAQRVAAEAAAATAAAAAAAASQPSEVVAMLQSQLASAQAQVVTLSVDLQAAKAASDAFGSAAEKLRPIVRAAVGNLRVALGGTAAGVEALADDTLLAEHANLASQFATKFKSGGVAAVSSSAESKDSLDVVSEAQRQSRLATIRQASATKKTAK